MSEKVDPTDPVNQAVQVLKSPLVMTILSVIVFMTPTILGWLPANAAAAAVIVSGLKVVAWIHGQLKAQTASIEVAGDVAIAKAEATNPQSP